MLFKIGLRFYWAKQDPPQFQKENKKRQQSFNAKLKEISDKYKDLPAWIKLNFCRCSEPLPSTPWALQKDYKPGNLKGRTYNIYYLFCCQKTFNISSQTSKSANQKYTHSFRFNNNIYLTLNWSENKTSSSKISSIFNIF